ncbi:MAG: hypothetical protein CMN56_05280 [Sneathiella sp.]|uniref:hypothetical protein n=1 Tax=Sneathiella sp. TaxID=1964365 RepID=UPI000C48E130|nr:hypothetical protein [Sneathiella sp.]MAZ02532.1 hypothetical protein [Sneathiella sp.]
MTELHIDSKSRKFDRRSALKGAAMLPAIAVPFIPSTSIAGNNDRAIAEMVAEYARCSAWVDNPACNTDEELSATMDAAHDAIKGLADTPADSLAGVREKIRWLEMPENFNNGCFQGKSSVNQKVLLSVFADIERLA